jgi:type I restriction enzyme M protein
MAFAEGDSQLVGTMLTLTDISKSVGVGVSAGSNWRKRHADFPQPIMVSGQEFFAADAVALWLGKRKIPRNRLRHDEVLGATYGDRFLCNSGVSAQSVQTTLPHVREESPPEWVNQLWRIRDLLRADLDVSSAFDFILAMLYIRTTNPELWHAVAGQRSWDTVDRMLRHVPFWDYHIPLVATAPDRSNERQLLEAIRLFGEIDLDSVGSAALFDALLDSSNRDLGWRGGHFTPSSVANCLVEMLDPQRTSTVYDPSCGSGELLVAAAQRGVVSLFGQAMNERSLQMADLNLLAHGGDAKLRMGGPEITGSDLPGENCDFVLANPPFNITLPEGFAEKHSWPFGEPGKNDANFAWLQIAFDNLKPTGRAGVIMPNVTLFAGGRNAAIRRKMIDAGAVDGIVALPAGLFPDTGISVSIWFLRRPVPDEPASSEVVFIDASSMGAKSGHSRRVLREEEITKIVQEYSNCRNLGRSATFARSVSIAEIQRNDYNLQPKLYLREERGSRESLAEMASTTLESLQGELDRIAQLANRTRQDVDAHLKALLSSDARRRDEASLGDICDIQAGPGAVNRERGLTVPGWTPLLLPRNIKRGFLSHDDLDTVKPEISTKLGSYRLLPGDIVCVRSGTLGRHGLVREEENGWLLGPSCLRLRPRTNRFVPEYLVHYLNSPGVQAWIESESSHSTAIPHIRAARLRELSVPLPPIALQWDIVTTIDSIDTHIKQWQRGALAMQSLRDLVFPALAE